MLKIEVEKKLNIVETELKNLKANLKGALQDVADNACEEAHEYIRDICEATKVTGPLLTIDITVYGIELPVGTDENDIQIHVNGKNLDYNSIDLGI